MKAHFVDQGTAAWLALRMGIPTASEFDKIITPKGAYSKSQTSRKYAMKLAAEKLLNRSLDTMEGIDAMDRGTMLEPQAAAAFEFIEGVETEKVGFCTSDDGSYGASPDRLIKGQPKGLEIKCPYPNTHIGYLIDGFGTDYHVQRQGQMFVCDFDSVFMYAWHPEMPPALEECGRDEPFIKLLKDGLEQFNDMLAEILLKARKRGAFGSCAIPETEWDDYLRRLDEKSMKIDAG